LDWKLNLGMTLAVKNKYLSPEKGVMLGGIMDFNQTSEEVFPNFFFCNIFSIMVVPAG
jgi:hypothetical protein